MIRPRLPAQSELWNICTHCRTSISAPCRPAVQQPGLARQAGQQRRHDSSTTASRAGEPERQRTTPSHHRRPNYGGFYNAILEQPHANVASARPIVVLDDASPTTHPPAGAANAPASSAEPADAGSSAAGGAPAAAAAAAAPVAAGEGNGTQQESKGGIVFYSRLAGYPVEAPVSVALNYAGVIVPPRPEEPLNCCQSGCIHCVWDLYREDVEEYQLKRTEARRALRAEGRAIPPELGGTPQHQGASDGAAAVAAGGEHEEAPERSMIEDLSPQLQAFIQLEKDLKAKRLSAS